MSSSGRPVDVDVELSRGVVAYVTYSRTAPNPGLRRPENVAAEAVRRSPEQLLDEVKDLLREVYRIPLGAAGGDFSRECQLLGAQIAERHPELTAEARSGLLNTWAIANR